MMEPKKLGGAFDLALIKLADGFLCLKALTAEMMTFERLLRTGESPATSRMQSQLDIDSLRMEAVLMLLSSFRLQESEILLRVSIGTLTSKLRWLSLFNM